jgi:hypothetical protein
MMYDAGPKFEIGCAAIAVTVVLAIGFLAGRVTAPGPELTPKPRAVSPFLAPPPAVNRFEGSAPRRGKVR